MEFEAAMRRTDVERAEIFINEKFYLIEGASALGGYRSSIAESHFLSADASDEALGLHLRLALRQSPALTQLALETAVALTREAAEHSYQRWVSGVMQRFDYRSKRALFANMKLCYALQQDKQIRLSPTAHERADQWTEAGFSAADDIVIASTASEQALGAAIRACLARATA